MEYTEEIKETLTKIQELVKKLTIPVVVGQSEQLPTTEDVKNAVKKQLNDNGYKTE